MIMKKNPENLRLSASQNGFTLIEMMIALAITLLVLSGVYEVFTSQQKAYSIQDQVAEMQQNARVAMDMMTREIKMAGYIAESWTGGTAPNIDVSVGGSATDASVDDIEEANTNNITFEGDINNNNNTDTVRYSLDTTNNELDREVCEWNSGTTLWCVSSSSTPVAENITNLVFRYYNSSGTQLTTLPLSSADRSSVRLIQISVTARTTREDSGYTHPTAGDGYRRRTLTANVRPRNLGL